MRIPRTLINLGWLSLVNAMWATQFPAFKIAADSMTVSALNLYSFLVAIATLLPFLIRERHRRGPLDAPLQSARARSAVMSFLLLGSLGLLPPSILMSLGIEHSSGSNAAILTLAVPVLMVVVAVPMLGERLTGSRLTALALALLGSILISLDDVAGSSFNASTLFGNVLIFAACLGSAFYNIYSKRLLSRYSELEVLVYGFVVAAALCAMASWMLDSRPFYAVQAVPLSAWCSVIVLGAVTWGISMVLFMWLLRRLDIGLISVSIYLLSFFGVLMSAALLGERVRLTQTVGALVVLAAALLSDSHERRSARLAKPV